MPEPRRLRVGNHHGVSIVEHVGDADRGVMVASITAAPGRSFEDARALAQEICDAVNAARRAAANVVVPHSKVEWR